MSLTALDWAVRYPIDVPATKLTLVIMAKMAQDCGHLWPKQGTLAELVGISERQLRRHLTALAESDTPLIQIHHQRNAAGHRIANYYTVLFPGAEPCSKHLPPPADISAEPPDMDVLSQPDTDDRSQPDMGDRSPPDADARSLSSYIPRMKTQSSRAHASSVAGDGDAPPRASRITRGVRREDGHNARKSREIEEGAPPRVAAQINQGPPQESLPPPERPQAAFLKVLREADGYDLSAQQEIDLIGRLDEHRVSAEVRLKTSAALVAHWPAVRRSPTNKRGYARIDTAFFHWTQNAKGDRQNGSSRSGVRQTQAASLEESLSEWDERAQRGEVQPLESYLPSTDDLPDDWR